MPKAVALSDYNAGSDQEISFKVCAHSSLYTGSTPRGSHFCVFCLSSCVSDYLKFLPSSVNAKLLNS